MLHLVTIDLTEADLSAFELYEAKVLRLVPKHAGRLEFRVRTHDGRTETHLLYFPTEDAFESFRADPERLALSAEWEACGARSEAQPVQRIAPADRVRPGP